MWVRYVLKQAIRTTKPPNFKTNISDIKTEALMRIAKPMHTVVIFSDQYRL
jgi:hypothetical protein